jgi:LPS export ABC transporter protein LptC
MKNFLLVLIILCFFSCENNFKEIKDINSYNFYPVGVSQNFKLIYTDSAKVKATLTALLNNDYTNQEFPYSEFPEGIEITFFDKDKNPTIITSNYAVMYSKTNIVDLIGDVIIKNHDGSILKTSQIFWDPQQEWLFTEKKFDFKNDDYDIVGKRLDANRSFTIFKTGKLDGKVMVEDQENKTNKNEY